MTDDETWLRQFREGAARDIATGFRLPEPVGERPKASIGCPIPKTIWIYWAQGWDVAPYQSKLCLSSWQRLNPDWTVHQLDDRTIGTYVDLGPLLDGKGITITGRSNFLRLNLLARHGGVWADSSTYCSRSLDEWLLPLLQSGFFAFARPGPDRPLSTWFLAASRGHYIVTEWLKLLERYWRAVDKADFYFWTHYLFGHGCRTDPRFNMLWHQTPWVDAAGPHAVQFQTGGQHEALRRALVERRIPVHKLETRRPALPAPDEETPLAWLLHDAPGAFLRGAVAAPRVSVVMSVYADFRFFDAAIDSILGQTFHDFELIVVDDGNGEDDRFARLAARDPRIRILGNGTNLGLPTSLNRGIAAARSAIIVRLDADDVAELQRIERAVAELDADPALDLVGSAVTIIDEADGVGGVQPMPESDLEIRWTLLFHNPFYHSTVAFRRGLFDAAGRYRTDKPGSEDHYLWSAMLPICTARNLRTPLTRYRHNRQGVTARRAAAERDPRRTTEPIRVAAWAELGLVYALQDKQLGVDVSAFLRGQGIAAVERRLPAYTCVLRVLRAFLAGPAIARSPRGAEDGRRLLADLLARMRDAPPAAWADRQALKSLMWLTARQGALALRKARRSARRP